MCIPGGYILQPRVIDESDFAHEPPVTRELWAYILRKVNFADTKVCKRGTGLFRYQDILNDLCWYVGYRKETYSKSQIAKSLRKMCEGNMTKTVKTTRGVFITICNYDKYQDPKNYEGNDEGLAKDSREKQCGSTIHKKVKEGEEGKELKNTTKALTAPIIFGNLNLTSEEIKEIQRIRKKNKGGEITQRVASSLGTQFGLAIDAGMTLDDCLTEWEDRSWKTFKWGWTDKGRTVTSVSAKQNVDGEGRTIL